MSESPTQSLHTTTTQHIHVHVYVLHHVYVHVRLIMHVALLTTLLREVHSPSCRVSTAAHLTGLVAPNRV